MLDTVTIGHALRRSRELAGISERHAARSIGVSRSTLKAWESDSASPSSDQITLAAAVFGHGVENVWAERTPLVSPIEPGVLVIGPERVAMADDEGRPLPNRVVLNRYLAAVRRQRGIDDGAQMELRADDLAVLSTVLDLDDESLQGLLTELLDMTPAGAQWALRSMLVGGLVAVAATGLLGSTWFAPPASATTAPAAPSAPPPTAAPASTSPVIESAVSPFDVGPALDTESSAHPPTPFSLGTATESAEVHRGSDAPDVALFSIEQTSTALVLTAPLFTSGEPVPEWQIVELFSPAPAHQPIGALGPTHPALPGPSS